MPALCKALGVECLESASKSDNSEAHFGLGGSDGKGGDLEGLKINLGSWVYRTCWCGGWRWGRGETKRCREKQVWRKNPDARVLMFIGRQGQVETQSYPQKRHPLGCVTTQDTIIWLKLTEKCKGTLLIFPTPFVTLGKTQWRYTMVVRVWDLKPICLGASLCFYSNHYLLNMTLFPYPPT